MTRNTVHRIVITATTIAATMLLGGCSSQPAPTTTKTLTTTATSSPSPTSATQATTSSPSGVTSSPTADGRVDPDAPKGQCADANLAVTVQDDPEASGAGQRLSYVVFRNTGSAACVLQGAPGLSLVGDGNGTQIGAAAERSTEGPTVSIAPGSYALAALTHPAIDQNGGAYGDGHGHDPACKAQPVDGYRVYPPHSFRAVFIRAKIYGCSTQLHIYSLGTVEPPSRYAHFKPTF